jgi:hypothetical protein
MAPGVYECPIEGKKLRTDRDAVDLIGEALNTRARIVVIPVERLDEDFFRLRTGVAGAFIQKFVQYHIKLLIVGDISAFVAASTALRDFVYEANRGKDFWFVGTREEMERRLLNAADI